MILRVPGDAVLLRAAPMERDDFPVETYWGTLSRSQVILIETFSPSRGRGLSKTAQFESFAAFAGRLNVVLQIERFHESGCQTKPYCIAGTHSIGIK